MIKNNKSLNKSFLFILVSLLAIVIVILFSDEKFTKEKWINYPDKRTSIVNNLIDDYELIGMTEKEILNLLGEPSYIEENILYYDLGIERSIYPIDHEFLHIETNNNVVVSATVHQH